MKANPSEFAPFHQGYVDLIEDRDLVEQMKERLDAVIKKWNSVPIEKHNFAYAPGKWTIKQMLGHMIDTERILSYRALCIARGEKQSLPGFDEDSYAENAHFHYSLFSDLLEEFELVRKSNIKMIGNFTDEDFSKTGNANGYDTTVRAFVSIIIGHEMHHANILHQRYLV